MDFSKGKIYRLVFPDNSYYYGSTYTTLEKRLYNHKCKHYYETSKLYQKWRQVGRNNVNIELVEAFPCNSKKELEERENIYIIEHLQNELCLNTKRAIEDPNYWRIYRESHLEEHRASARKYEAKKRNCLLE